MSTLFDWVELPDTTEPMIPLDPTFADELDQVGSKNTGGTEPMIPMIPLDPTKKHNTCSKSVCVCKIFVFTHTHDDSYRYPLEVGSLGSSGIIGKNYTCDPENGSGIKVEEVGSFSAKVGSLVHPHWLTELSCYTEYAACSSRVEKNGLLLALWEPEGSLSPDEVRLMDHLERELGAPITNR